MGEPARRSRLSGAEHYAGKLSLVEHDRALRTAAWTGQRNALDVATQLQAAGIEAVPVQDFADVDADPQVAHREHFIELPHPEFGPGKYERNGFRLAGTPSGYDRSGPTLGQDNDWVLCEILQLPAGEQERLVDAGALS